MCFTLKDGRQAVKGFIQSVRIPRGYWLPHFMSMYQVNPPTAPTRSGCARPGCVCGCFASQTVQISALPISRRDAKVDLSTGRKVWRDAEGFKPLKGICVPTPEPYERHGLPVESLGDSPRPTWDANLYGRLVWRPSTPKEDEKTPKHCTWAKDSTNSERAVNQISLEFRK